METELWNIFSFYTLHGNPLDPEHIRVRATSPAAAARPCAVCGAPPHFPHLLALLTLPLQCTQFVKLARDCQLVGTTLSEASPPLLEADIQVVYTAEVKRADRGSSALQKMNYNDFLTALMKIAIKVYPRSHTGASCRDGGAGIFRHRQSGAARSWARARVRMPLSQISRSSRLPSPRS